MGEEVRGERVIGKGEVGGGEVTREMEGRDVTRIEGKRGGQVIDGRKTRGGEVGWGEKVGVRGKVTGGEKVCGRRVSVRKSGMGRRSRESVREGVGEDNQIR